ncbi:MAG: hypothetical protein H0U23_05010 [Blastocatellia bacterium]|nr:hypothetical protein [Blastocatellia bacterium]
MVRAGIFIGVDQTGNLQKLKDAAAGAQRMHAWAIAQGMVDQTHARLITDRGGKTVDPNKIYDAIKEIIDGPGVDQLIVYFAGHGVNINRGEQWLLTEAPVRTNAAVNLKGSVDLAQYSGIKHVVFFSDACRVAPDGIQAGNVRGTEIFPNDSSSDVSNPVDQFFACGLGKTAAELKDPAVAAGNFSALYTDALLAALEGDASEAFNPEPPTDPNWRYVGTATLRDYLAKEVPKRVISKKLTGKVNQNPDAIVIASRNWISRLPRGGTSSIPVFAPSPPPPTLQNVASALVNSTIAGVAPIERTATRGLKGVGTPATDLEREIFDAAKVIEPPFGPDHFETEWGIKVRGARVTDVFASRVANLERLGEHLVRIQRKNESSVSVLLHFDNDTCAVVPAIHGYLAALTFEEGELVDVAYEPATTNHRWRPYQQKMEKLRRLRAVIAAATGNGYFRLDEANAFSLARQMQYEKSIDPTLSVYAAYAYYDLQRKDIIREMAGYLQRDINATLFDLMLLGRRLVDREVKPQDHIVPFFPLLSQGWALLDSNRVKRHPVLRKIESKMKSSLWTLFDGGAFAPLKETIERGDAL